MPMTEARSGQCMAYKPLSIHTSALPIFLLHVVTRKLVPAHKDDNNVKFAVQGKWTARHLASSQKALRSSAFSAFGG